MKMTRNSHYWLRIQNLIFYVLLLTAVVLLARLTTHYNYQFDWTLNSRNTLSDTSLKMLQDLDKDITVQVFASQDFQYKGSIEELLARYQTVSNKLTVSYIDPQFEPDLVRSLNIQQQGEIVISQGELKQHVFDLSEQSLTNAIIAVARQQQPWIVFVEGHGERSPFGQHNFNLSNWAEQLKNKGFKLQAINLFEQKAIPENTQVLVIASSQQNWLPGEISLVQDYINQGGNLLWLTEPDQTASLTGLAETLGLDIPNKTVLDPNAVMLGVDDPRFVLVSDYANHPIGQAIANVTLLAEATIVERAETETEQDWQYTNLLNSQPDAWLESEAFSQDTLHEQIYDPETDLKGPLPLAYLLTRTLENEQQRIAVIGDGDFVSNAYLGNGGNLQLAMATANWLSHDDALIPIPVKTTVGTQLTLTEMQSMLIGFGFLLVLPILFLLTGFTIWWRRRQR